MVALKRFDVLFVVQQI